MTGSGVLGLLMRLLLVLLSAVFVVSLVVAGLFVVFVSVVWQLLHGRKPTVFHIYTQFRDASRRFRAGGFSSAPPARTASDVVDVDAHEVDGIGRLK